MMRESGLKQARRRFGWALAGVAGVAIAWAWAPGMPVWWGPHAGSARRAEGAALFVREWEPHDPEAGGDGLGPVFNARSCVACHFQGGVGGGGDNATNVLAFEALPTPDRPDIQGGLVHKYAVANRFLEDASDLRALFPIIPDGITVGSGCYVLTQDYDPVKTDRVNASPLFGGGWIDRISTRSITRRNLVNALGVVASELRSDFGAMPPGRYRVLSDGRVGKYGWKAQFATLEEFVAAACANEIGLGNPHMPQAKPRVEVDYPEVEADLDREQFRSLVAFVDTLPRPIEAVPESAAGRAEVARGRLLFEQVGCAFCHVPDLGGVSGIYTDLLLHRLVDRDRKYRETLPDVPIPREHPDAEEWRTPPLWGVADSAPYFHDGGSPTLEAAIARHEGDASPVTKGFDALGPDDRRAVIRFLETLQAPPDAVPVPSPAEDRDAVTVASAD